MSTLPIRGLLTATVLAGGLCLPAMLCAADAPSWPQFHGPKGINLSTETGLLKQWPEEGPKRLWTAKGMGQGFASVAIANGLIYTDGNVKDETAVTALDLDGKIQWQVPNGKAWTGGPAGSRGTPTIDGDRLYLENPHGDVVCLDAKTGKKLWDLNILKKFKSQNITWALSESLLIDGDRLICCPGGQETAVVALDKKSGETVWKSPTSGDLISYATPALAEYKGLRMILTMTGKALIGVNADTGDLLFRHEHHTAYDVNALRPIFHDGQIFISSGYGAGSEMLKVTVDGAKASVEKLWDTKDMDNHHGGVILLDGYLYGSCMGPKWACLEWKTGKKMYSEKGVGKGSLTYADGMLYTLSENSKMGLVKATPDGHKVISDFKLPKGGSGPSWAHPVVCGGRLYIRYDDLLHAYDVKE